MAVSVDKLHSWMEASESENLEFKEAKNEYNSDKLKQYCTALANEGGGKLVLGVTDKFPRHVVGSQAFLQPGKIKYQLLEQIGLSIDIEEVIDPDGRVLVFHVPSRPIGQPLAYKKIYWMRSGESLVSMPPDRLKTIFAEAVPDFSAEVCPKAVLDDLDSKAIATLRRLWDRRSPNQHILTIPLEQLLTDAELLVDGKLTYAALILLGTHQALGRRLAQAELIFEYRSTEVPGPATERHEFRQGFLCILDTVWDLVNKRNDQQHFQQGFCMLNISMFNEQVVREAVLNAVSHRDYQHSGSVFVRQYPRRIEIDSPGGFPDGITTENVLSEQNPRNRRIAEVLGKCGLVERAGQGFDLIFSQCIAESKPLPDFTHTNKHSVKLALYGEIQNEGLLRFLEKVGQEQVARFNARDFLVIYAIAQEQPIRVDCQSQIKPLLDQGIIERTGRGRGSKLLLSRRYYQYVDQPGTHTRRRGLDKETNKELLLRHIRDNQQEGSPLRHLKQVLPGLSRSQVQYLLRELKREGQIYSIGIANTARWYLKN